MNLNYKLSELRSCVKVDVAVPNSPENMLHIYKNETSKTKIFHLSKFLLQKTHTRKVTLTTNS